MTGCERILARLEHGPATAAELYATTYTVVHSRIADLRKRGYSISCEHVGGTGAETYVYRLLSDSRSIPSPAIAEHAVVPLLGPSPAACSTPVQLRLVGAAEREIDLHDFSRRAGV